MNHTLTRPLYGDVLSSAILGRPALRDRTQVTGVMDGSLRDRMLEDSGLTTRNNTLASMRFAAASDENMADL